MKPAAPRVKRTCLGQATDLFPGPAIWDNLTVHRTRSRSQETA